MRTFDTGGERTFFGSGLGTIQIKLNQCDIPLSPMVTSMDINPVVVHFDSHQGENVYLVLFQRQIGILEILEY